MGFCGILVCKSDHPSLVLIDLMVPIACLAMATVYTYYEPDCVKLNRKKQCGVNEEVPLVAAVVLLSRFNLPG
jgi:hypothetical protein